MGIDAHNMSWEDYDDQVEGVFTHVGYVDLKGVPHLDPIRGKLVLQVAEIRRKNGSKTPIRVYCPKEG